MSNKPPFVSVIIPTYHDWDRLEICIKALKEQTYPKERFEVVIINNDPNDTPPELDPQENFTLLSEPKPGSYAARNAGIQIAKGEILAFTDSDCTPFLDWVEKAVAFFSQNPGVDRLAGQVNLFLVKGNSASSLYEKVFAFNQETNARKGTSVTANMWARKKVFDITGVFDHHMKSGADVLWGRKANEKGHIIAYAPLVRVWHPARYDINQLIIKARRVYGGIFYSKGFHVKPLLVKIILSAYPLRIPFHAICMVLVNNQLSLYSKLKVLLVLFVLRLYQFGEHVKLARDNDSKR